MQSNRPVTAFSHLRWDFVYRRPQHLLSRLASGHRVIFVEEPVTGSGEKPAWEFSTPEPGILVCRPHTPSDSPGYSAQQLPYIKQLLHEFLERGESRFLPPLVLHPDGAADFAGHIMFSNHPYVHRLYRMLLGENVHWQDREWWIDEIKERIMGGAPNRPACVIA